MKKQLANSNLQLASAVSAHPIKVLPRSHEAKKESRVASLFASAWGTATAILREVFDESAYERFLVRSGKKRSVDSYREFSREREASVARKPRCC